MRVLLWCRGSGTAPKGGDWIVMEGLARTLAADPSVEPRVWRSDRMAFPSAKDLEPYDVVHLFNALTPSETLHVAAAAGCVGKPIVLTTLYWPMDTIMWLVQAFGRGVTLEKLKQGLPDIEQGTWMHNSLELWPGFRRMVEELVNSVDLMHTVAEPEFQHLCRRFGVYDKPHFCQMHLWLLNRPPSVEDDRVAQTITHGEPFILSVGRLEVRKNQLLLAMAVKKAGVQLPIVFAGRTKESVWQEQIQRTGCDAVFLGHVPSGVLSALYERCVIHAAPSLWDLPGLAHLEALAHGKTTVAGDYALERLVMGDYAEYCNPLDLDSIASAVRRALDRRIEPVNIQGDVSAYIEGYRSLC